MKKLLFMTAFLLSCGKPPPPNLGSCTLPGQNLCFEFENMGKEELTPAASQYICEQDYQGSYQAQNCSDKDLLLTCLMPAKDNVSIKIFIYMPWKLVEAQTACLKQGGKY